MAYFHDMDWVFTFVNYTNIFSIKQISNILENNFPRKRKKNSSFDNFEEEVRKNLAKTKCFSALRRARKSI